MHYIGIDYAKQRSHWTAMTTEGVMLKRGYVANTPEGVTAFLAALPADECAVAIEACRNWTVIYELVVGQVTTVTLAHPLKVKAIASARIKTDRIDSRMLADLLRTNLLPAAHIRAAAVRAQQAVVRQRAYWVKLRMGVRNHMHGLLDRQAPALRAAYHEFADVFTQTGHQWLQTAALPDADRALLRRYLAVEQVLTEQSATALEEIEHWVTQDPPMQLVDSIPGFGPLLAALVVLEIDGIARFGSAEQLASYAGLVPSTYSSGAVTRHGAITKQGNRWLRWAFVEAVRGAVVADPALRQFYERVKARRGTNPAKVATARKLCGLVFQVLQRGTAYVRCHARAAA